MNQSLLSPTEARERLIKELDLSGFSEEAQDRLITTAIDALMKEVLIAVFSFIPESEYKKVEKLAEAEELDAMQSLITKFVAAEKIAEIIEGIWQAGIANYKKILAKGK